MSAWFRSRVEQEIEIDWVLDDAFFDHTKKLFRKERFIYFLSICDCPLIHGAFEAVPQLHWSSVTSENSTLPIAPSSHFGRAGECPLCPGELGGMTTLHAV
eukprot:s285_g10.t1